MRQRLVVLGGEGVVDGLRNGLLQAVDEDERDVARRAEVRAVVHLDLVLDVAVVPVHADHEDREDRDRDEDEVRAVRELGDGHDDEHQHREARAERVDDETLECAPPLGGAARVAFRLGARRLAQHPSPVPDHADLPERERHEDADDVELDERRQVRLVDHDDAHRDDAQDDHAVRVHEAVAARVERLRRVAVAREHRAEQREAVERRVRRQEEDDRCRRLDHVEGDRPHAERRGGDLGHEARLGGVLAVEADEVAGVLGVVDARDQRERRQAGEEQDRDRAHERERGLRIADLGLAERGDAVGDGLDAGEGRAAAREGAQDQQEDRSLGEALGLHRVLGARGDGRVAERRADEARHDHDPDRADEDVRRDREEEGRFAHPAEVDDDDEDDEADRELDAGRVELRQRRDDVVDAGRDRHRDRQDVVDEQRGRDDDAGHFAEVRARDFVVAAARGIRLDELPVARRRRRARSTTTAAATHGANARKASPPVSRIMSSSCGA